MSIMRIKENPGANPGLNITPKGIVATVQGDHKNHRLSNLSGLGFLSNETAGHQIQTTKTSPILPDNLRSRSIGFPPSYGSHKEETRRCGGGGREEDEAKDYVSVVLPNNLNVDYLLKGKETGIRSNDKISKICYFINTVSSNIVSRYNEPLDFQNKHFDTLASILGCCQDVRPVKTFCEDAKILECDNLSFTKSDKNKFGKSLGYRLTKPYRNHGFKRVSLGSPSMARRLAKHRKNQVKEVIETLACGDYLNSSIERFDFHDSVLEHLWAIYQNQSMSQGQKDCRFFTWEWMRGYERKRIFHSSRKTGRLFTNITQLPKDLRRLLTVDGEPTIEIDLSNSQPFLLACSFPAGTREMDHFRDVASNGRFYETLNDALEQPYTDRKKLKIDCYRKIFFRTHYVDNHPLCTAMSKLWPTVFATVESWRRIPTRTLACDLQKKESDLIFGDCVTRIQQEIGCPIATVHDSFVVPSSKAKRIYDLVRETVTEKMGLTPMLKLESALTETSNLNLSV